MRGSSSAVVDEGQQRYSSRGRAAAVQKCIQSTATYTITYTTKHTQHSSSAAVHAEGAERPAARALSLGDGSSSKEESMDAGQASTLLDVDGSWSKQHLLPSFMRLSKVRVCLCSALQDIWCCSAGGSLQV